MHHCFKCQSELQLSKDGRVGRSDECPKCRIDLHVCLNCSYFDQTAYNQCREPQAERVLDKDRRNFCDYFSFKSGKGTTTSGQDQRDAAISKLDELFKK